MATKKAVADPGGLSCIKDPDFIHSRSWISDPVYNHSTKRGWGKNFVLPFIVATNITTLKIILNR
jgi:hypothetical protein